eukprot:Colp12_sorted_trinity150504_noHs@34754
MASDSVALGLTSDVVHIDPTAVWKVMVDKIFSPNKFLPVSDVKIEHKDGYTWRSMLIVPTKVTMIENIYANEKNHMIRFVILNSDGSEGPFEIINKLNILDPSTNACTLEYYKRKTTSSADSSEERVFWEATRAMVAGSFAKTFELASQ